MIFKNLLLDGNTVDITCENGIITAIGKADGDGTDFGSREVLAGLVDIHTHGMSGIDTMDAQTEKLAREYALCGITTVYPTTMTAPHENIIKVLETCGGEDGAFVPGFHLEGPYINKAKRGAQNESFVRLPDVREFDGYGNIKIVTVAPEVEGAIEYIKSSDALICLGHTLADYDCADKAFKAGAKCVTHLFNAMPPLAHREPSVLGAASDNNAFVQLICDGKHIHPSVIRLIYKLFGRERMVLISDSMRATHLPDGKYEFGGLEITVKDSVARTPDGALAGSTSTLFECVQKAIEFGIPKEDAFIMASRTPARLMGLNCGELKVGRRCDFITLDKCGNLKNVVVGGKIIK